MSHGEGTAEKDYHSNDMEDFNDDSNDSDDGDPTYEVDSDGNVLLSKDDLIRSYNRLFNCVKCDVSNFDKFLKSGPSRTVAKEQKGTLLALLEFKLKWADLAVKMLLERGSPDEKVETILQKHSDATAQVSAIKARFDILS